MPDTYLVLNDCPYMTNDNANDDDNGGHGRWSLLMWPLSGFQEEAKLLPSDGRCFKLP